MTRVSLSILIAGSLIAWAIANVDAASTLHPTASGVIDRTNRTDRLKSPPLDVRVECRSA